MPRRLGAVLAYCKGVVLQDIGGVHNAMPVAVPALEHLKVNYRTHSGIMNVSSLDVHVRSLQYAARCLSCCCSSGWSSMMQQQKQRPERTA